jgi:hypothetical protein
MKLYETESLSEKERDKLTSYFKLAKKIKEFQRLTPLVMIALFGEKKETDYGYLCRQCDRNADMYYLLVLRTKIYSGTNSENEILQRIKRIWRNINRQHYV